MEGKTINNYCLEKCIGKGPRSYVYVSTFKGNNDLADNRTEDTIDSDKSEDHSKYAIKIIDRIKLNEKERKGLKNEIKVLKELKHPNIIRFKEDFIHMQYTCIITQYCENNSLAEFLKNRSLTMPQKIRIISQILSAVQYLHDSNIIHRDIKLENVFLTKDLNAKLGDFGFSAFSSDLNKSICGTPYYMAPEVINKQSYSHKADIWSIGVLIYKILYNTYPFNGKTLSELAIAQQNSLLFPYEATNEQKNILQKILELDPNKRIEIGDLLIDEYFNPAKKLSRILMQLIGNYLAIVFSAIHTVKNMSSVCTLMYGTAMCRKNSASAHGDAYHIENSPPTCISSNEIQNDTLESEKKNIQLLQYKDFAIGSPATLVTPSGLRNYNQSPSEAI